MKARALIIPLFLLASTCGAQVVTIMDRSSLRPLPDVTVTDGRQAITSDLAGRADLSALGSGALTFRLLGYAEQVIDRPSMEAADGRVLLNAVPFTMDEFVLSASRFREKRRDVPEQVTVLKSRDISFLDQQSTGDLLQNSGALYVQKSQMGGGSPVIRGFESSRVLLVVDGVRLNNAIYRSGHVQDIMTVDQNTVERIEVISGPASVVYGSDALGGVVHLMTRSAAFNDTSGLRVGGGAFFRYSTANSEETVHAEVSLSARRVSSFTSITASDFGDLRQGSTRDPLRQDIWRKPFTVDRVNGQNVVIPNDDSNVQVGTAYGQLDVMEKLRVRSGDRTVHKLNLQLSTSTDVPRYDRLSEFSVDTAGAIIPAFSEWYYGPQKRLLAAYTLEMIERSCFDQARITTSYQAIEQSRHSLSFTSSHLGSRVESVNVFGLNADFEKRIKRHELRYGLEGYHNAVASVALLRNVDTGAEAYLTTRYPNGGSTMDHVAAYLSHTLEINERWVVSEGLRYTWVGLDATFDDPRDYQFLNGTLRQRNSAFNWRLGVMFMPGKDWRVTALGSTGFRAPNVDDLGKVFDSAPGRVIVPNPDLRPERTTNAELGLSKTFNSRYTIELNAFHTLFTDALVVSDYTVDGQDSIVYDGTLSRVTALSNRSSAYLQGASGQVSLRFDGHFTLTGSLTYTHGRVRTDSADAPLDHIPPTYGRIGLEYRADRLRGEVYALANGWKRLRDYSTTGEDNLRYATPEGMPAWCTINVRAAYAFTQAISLQVALENIADLNYRTFASGVSAPGRNLQVSLRASF